MFFYDDMTTPEQRTYYNQMLEMMGSLSNLYSDSDKPFLVSRVTENLFCRCLGAENLSRGDVTADAKKGAIGVGIKTWIGSNLQKIAEFDSLKPEYEHDADEAMIRKIAGYRNDRIDFTLRTHALTEMVYHCTIRDTGLITVQECALVPIDTDHIRHIQRRKNSITFDDGLNEYSFSVSKSTLYKRFDDLTLLQSIPVTIIDDPYAFLADRMGYAAAVQQPAPAVRTGETLIASAVLPLYSENGAKGKYVPPKNNLNMRFAGGRARNEYEIGIPIPAEFRRRFPDFFLGRDVPFRLVLPDGAELTAKQCQADGKALMSNPNSALGEWLINKVLQIPPSVPITYEMLVKYGIDSVELQKIRVEDTGEIYYKIDFALAGSYETYKGEWA